MKKHTNKNRKLWLENQFRKELKTQEQLRIKQFTSSTNGFKDELLHRAKFATTILKAQKA